MDLPNDNGANTSRFDNSLNYNPLMRHQRHQLQQQIHLHPNQHQHSTNLVMEPRDDRPIDVDTDNPWSSKSVLEPTDASQHRTETTANVYDTEQPNVQPTPAIQTLDLPNEHDANLARPQKRARLSNTIDLEDDASWPITSDRGTVPAMSEVDEALLLHQLPDSEMHVIDNANESNQLLLRQNQFLMNNSVDAIDVDDENSWAFHLPPPRQETVPTYGDAHPSLHQILNSQTKSANAAMQGVEIPNQQQPVWTSVTPWGVSNNGPVPGVHCTSDPEILFPHQSQVNRPIIPGVRRHTHLPGQNFDSGQYHGGTENWKPPTAVNEAEDMKNLLELNEQTADATEEVDTPKELNVELMPHQKRALFWMSKRENPVGQKSGASSGIKNCRGGILADDQGLGKTLTTLSLCYHNAGDDDKPWRTLIVCPVSLVNQWKREIQTRVHPQYRKSVYLYHGSNRTKATVFLKRYDFVITTYQTLAHEYEKILTKDPSYEACKQAEIEPPKRKPGAAYKLTWNRVILDEAHHIRNRGTDAWKAVASLQADIRWALSGTPIQNKMDDMYALTEFIRYYFVRNTIEWNQRWKRLLDSRIPSVRERAFKKFQAIIGVVLLRRSKTDKINGKPLIVLPEREVIVLQEKFADPDEIAYYKAVEAKTVVQFNKFLMSGTITHNYTSVLLLLLRLRQAVCHPFLIEYTRITSNQNADETGELNKTIEKAMNSNQQGKQSSSIRSVLDNLYAEIRDEEDDEEEEAVVYSDDDDFIDDRSDDEIMNDRGSTDWKSEVGEEGDEDDVPKRVRKKSRVVVIDDSDDEGYIDDFVDISDSDESIELVAASGPRVTNKGSGPSTAPANASSKPKECLGKINKPPMTQSLINFKKLTSKQVLENSNKLTPNQPLLNMNKSAPTRMPAQTNVPPPIRMPTKTTKKEPREIFVIGDDGEVSVENVEVKIEKPVENGFPPKSDLPSPNQILATGSTISVQNEQMKPEVKLEKFAPNGLDASTHLPPLQNDVSILTIDDNSGVFDAKEEQKHVAVKNEKFTGNMLQPVFDLDSIPPIQNGVKHMVVKNEKFTGNMLQPVLDLGTIPPIQNGVLANGYNGGIYEQKVESEGVNPYPINGFLPVNSNRGLTVGNYNVFGQKNEQMNAEMKMEHYATNVNADGVPIPNEVLEIGDNGQISGEKKEKKPANKKELAQRIMNAVMQPSQKVKVLIEKLEETRREEPERKTLVFSQWTSCLDIISYHLDKANMQYTRLDGSMSMAKRNNAITKFRDDPKKTVFLISLHAGGTGLNLTFASQVFLFDVWWNPATEEQAIDRVHRIGQTRAVRVFRFQMMGTVEDKIYDICARKRETIVGALGQEGAQTLGRQKLSMADLISLFSSAAQNVVEDGGAAAAAARNILRAHG